VRVSSEISVEDIKAKVKGSMGGEVFFYETVGSTNMVAADFAERGGAEGVVVIADSQEKGRGRLGRVWVSPPGVNIYMSILLRPKIEPKDATLITIVAAVGCAYALRKMTGLNVTIRWPNDLIISDKKIGGILTELKITHKKILYAITGIGVNVNADLGAFPEDIRETTSSIKKEKGVPYSRTDLIVGVLNEIDYWYKMLERMKRKELLHKWRQLTSTIGKKVRITLGKEILMGIAESIDDEGMLMLRLPSGTLRRISTGDLTLLRC
jgi:BirA family biotin operon repressor/biotin-[acetyl-CoA-carboxylase] ligase